MFYYYQILQCYIIIKVNEILLCYIIIKVNVI
jgi:hypothetical protein